ncbi:DctP family TRAP transporter solute-binding subunit [Methyloferula stellata]|uniref:DctP family TRAP transporter solute-binding subunit n=1 Tax=Methyloferula stellata TaxID=876270 RepID=UPI001FCC21EB|nr:DctP family TRAP transporter solute-binding subunit [Methyloferula stellata]
MRFGYILSPDSQLGEGEKVFAAEVAARTGGRFIIEDYPNAMLGGEVAMMNDVKLGALDVAFITGAPLPKLLPEAGVFNIPFLFRDAGEARVVLDGPIGNDYLTKFNQTGLHALAWGENGMRHITNSKRPIRTPEDLAGLKLRLPQSDVMTAGFKALGADVQQIPFPRVYGTLRGGSVDGEENPIATILSTKFYEVQTYLTLTGHVYDPAVIIMSADAFDALSEADKRIFKEAARLAGRQSRKIASEVERTGVATLKANGMVVIEKVDKLAFAERVAAASPEFEKEFGRDEIEKIKSAAAAASQMEGPAAEAAEPGRTPQ